MLRDIRDAAIAILATLALIVIVSWLVASPARADAYIGLQAGQAWQDVPAPSRALNSFELDGTAPSGRLSLGYEAENWGFELGYAPILSRVSGHATTDTHDIRQDITTSALDLRGHYGVNFGPMQARAIAGIAAVRFENHEWGTNPLPAEHRNADTQFAPLYGIGLRYKLTDTVGLTVDFIQIPNVARSHWTKSSDITTALAGVTVRLP